MGRAVSMRKKGKGNGTIGCLAVILGIIIILIMVLPAGFWWFALAGALIIGGLFFLRC
jgi:hypothetical protein